MCAQVTLATEGFRADATGERFDTAVQFQVSLAVLFACEPLVTDRTLVRFLS